MSETQFTLEPQFPDEQGSFTEIASEANLAHEEDVPLSAEAVTLAGQMGRITKKLETKMQELATEGEAIARRVNGIVPKDQASYAELCEQLGECKKFSDKLEEWAEPWRSLFYRPYKAVLERVKIIDMAPANAQATGKSRRLTFERETREAEQKRETLRLQAEQKKREEETRIANAMYAEELKMSTAAVETLLTAPSLAPTPVAAPMISRPLGTRKIPPNWQAEISDQAAFWKWARQQKEMPTMLLIDGPTMNREAKTHKATLGNKYPGFRGVNKGGD